MTEEDWYSAAGRLAEAKSVVDQMRQANEVEIATRLWNAFTAALHDAFNEMVRVLAKSADMDAIRESVIEARKNDPLICYLRLARNYRGHAGAEPLRAIATVVEKDGGPPSPITSFEIEIEKFDRSIEAFDTTEFKGVTFSAIEFQYEEFEDRGLSVPAPTTHLGMPLPDQHPITLAAYAIDFAGNKLEEARTIILAR